MRVDVHQHLLPEDLVSALSRRTQVPRITKGTLHIAGEPPSPFDLADHDPTTRTTHDRIVIALSSALGIEGLPPDEAEPLLDAYNTSAAWHAFAAWGRPCHPRLRVVYAMLAGGAPLHAERLLARGGPGVAIHDPLAWFDVSSYGPLTLDAMIRMLGVDRLLYGSDRPVAAPPALGALGHAVEHALTVTNAEWALAPRLSVGVLA